MRSQFAPKSHWERPPMSQRSWILAFLVNGLAGKWQMRNMIYGRNQCRLKIGSRAAGDRQKAHQIKFRAGNLAFGSMLGIRHQLSVLNLLLRVFWPSPHTIPGWPSRKSMGLEWKTELGLKCLHYLPFPQMTPNSYLSYPKTTSCLRHKEKHEPMVDVPEFLLPLFKQYGYDLYRTLSENGLMFSSLNDIRSASDAFDFLTSTGTVPVPLPSSSAN